MATPLISSFILSLEVGCSFLAFAIAFYLNFCGSSLRQNTIPIIDVFLVAHSNVFPGHMSFANHSTRHTFVIDGAGQCYCWILSVSLPFCPIRLLYIIVGAFSYNLVQHFQIIPSFFSCEMQEFCSEMATHK